jgi:hypothetical protein
LYGTCFVIYVETTFMKQVLLFSSLFLTMAIAEPARAQVSVQINIGSQPQWGPDGYDYVDYYYLPDIEAYYYVPTRQFIYLEGDRWIFATNLPYRCRDYDLFGGYKVVINGRDPYRNHWEHRRRYAPYCNHQPQIILRDRGYGYGGNGNINRGYNRQYRYNNFDNGRRNEIDRDDDRRRNRDNDRYSNNNGRRDGDDARNRFRDNDSRHERNEHRNQGRGRGNGRHGR